jgi:SAM-dependent methyltransferase
MLSAVREDLEETPRFHRKQWEFAAILMALRARGLLATDRTGLSLGAGRERILYAVARRVRRVVATDLYEADSGWEGARTDDPEAWVRAGAPFPVEDGRLTARRMDMRSLDFPARSFDFCYSSCAIEHIGGRDDFLRHLREVGRVLQEGGVYAFTTEFHYGPELISHPENFVFPADYLRDLIAESGLAAEPVCAARIAPHKVNFPLPANLPALCFAGEGAFMAAEHPHVQLLRGACPHTSALFVLRKGGGRGGPISFEGLAASRDFLSSAIQDLRRRLAVSRLSLDPFAAGGGPGPVDTGGTVFHSDYVWLGSGGRTFAARLLVTAASPDCALELRLHRYRTLGSLEVECAGTLEWPAAAGPLAARLSAAVEDSHCYALLAHVVRGRCQVAEVVLEVLPAGRDHGTKE